LRIRVQESVDTKVVIKIRKSKNKQCNGQKNKDKRPNNDISIYYTNYQNVLNGAPSLGVS